MNTDIMVKLMMMMCSADNDRGFHPVPKSYSMSVSWNPQGWIELDDSDMMPVKSS